jgi:hypothetical protein
LRFSQRRSRGENAVNFYPRKVGFKIIFRQNHGEKICKAKSALPNGVGKSQVTDCPACASRSKISPREMQPAGAAPVHVAASHRMSLILEQGRSWRGEGSSLRLGVKVKGSGVFVCAQSHAVENNVPSKNEVSVLG